VRRWAKSLLSIDAIEAHWKQRRAGVMLASGEVSTNETAEIEGDMHSLPEVAWW